MVSSAPRRRRRWLIALAVLIGVAATAAIVVRVVIHDDARRVPIAEVIDRYRETTATAPMTTSQPSAQTPPETEAAPVTAAPATAGSATTAPAAALPVPELPPTGVYTYRTEGQESVDALGGTTHSYPAETTITVTQDGCGVLLRWDALRERRDEWRLCTGPAGIELEPLGLQYHEFYSHPDSEAVACDRAVLIVPADQQPRPAVSLDCMLASDPWLPTWEVLGIEQRQVEGATVTVTHVRMTIVDDDEYDEHTTIDWFLDEHGLPVEVRNSKHSTSPSPIGSVVYDETYSLELVSLVPLR